MKNKKRIMTLLIVMLFSMTALLAGCGSSSQAASVEEWVNDSEEGKLIMKAMNFDEEMKVTAEVNNVLFTFKDTEAVDEEDRAELAEIMEESFDEMAADFEDMKKDISEGSGIDIDDITIKTVYIDSEGTEIFSKDY